MPETITFSAMGYSPDHALYLSKLSGFNQAAEVNKALSNPIVVKVTDILGSPVSGANVLFSVTSGGGTLTNTAAVQTDSSGFASNILTMGSVAGETRVSVSSAGLIGSPVSFTAHAVLPGGSLGDTDGDGLPDDWETSHGLDPLDGSDAGLDSDNDTLSNLDEYIYGTDIDNSDTDYDGMPDNWEIQYGLDPTDASDAGNDADGDGVTNLDEYTAGTVPVLVRHFQIAGVTSESMDFYGDVTINGLSAEVGDEIAAFDPEGVVCGQFTVTTQGRYGFMHVYKDDPATEQDEGVQQGDKVTFRIWDSGEGVELDATTNVIIGADPVS